MEKGPRLGRPAPASILIIMGMLAQFDVKGEVQRKLDFKLRHYRQMGNRWACPLPQTADASRDGDEFRVCAACEARASFDDELKTLSGNERHLAAGNKQLVKAKDHVFTAYWKR
jgi:hypothetical protein